MENQFAGAGDSNAVSAVQKNTIGLPLVALGLDLAPVLLIWLSSLGTVMSAFALMLAVMMPLAGLTTGIVALVRGKGKLGLAGKIIAIIAVALPLALVAFIIVFFIGAMTGVISFM